MEGSQYLHTPEHSEQDVDDVNGEESHADLHCYENPYDPQEYLEEDDEEEAPPRAMRRTPAVKKPRITHHEVDEDAPDLAAYFSLFENFSELDQVKYCRAYANALSAKTPRNRMRYSHKKRFITE